MAEPTPKVYTEDEHLAILADRVSRETAEVTTKLETATTELTEASTKLDVAESAKIAAEQAATKVQEEFDSFKAEVEQREAAAARKDTRLAEVKEKAPHLDDAFFTEDRIARIVAKSDEDFTAYVSDLVDSVPPVNGERREIPRETAMVGTPVTGGAKVSAGRAFILRDYEAPKEG